MKRGIWNLLLKKDSQACGHLFVYVWILFCTDALIYLNFLHICVEEVESYYRSVTADSWPCFSFLFLCFPDVACRDRWQETQHAGKKAAALSPWQRLHLPLLPSRLSPWAGCNVQHYSGFNCDIHLQYSWKRAFWDAIFFFLNGNVQHHFYTTRQIYFCPEFETNTGLIVCGKKLNFQEYTSK